MNDYYVKMMNKLASSLSKNYCDNYDSEISQLSGLAKFQVYLAKALELFIKVTGRNKGGILLLPENNFYLNELNRFAASYDMLCDEDSRDKFIELVAYKALGPTKVKLTLNNNDFFEKRKNLELCKLEQVYKIKNFRSNLSLFDMKSYGYDLKLFFVLNGIYVDFVLQQYNYNEIVCVNAGDVVIDAGACWGDTALYFASRGAQAVYSYEFIPSNLDVFRKNISLNIEYAAQIHIVEHAVWSESKNSLSYDDRGPGSQVGAPNIFEGKTETLSIDDLVDNYGLESLDFIKMDIEGAEMPALRGAEKSIIRFKPKLAISVYHKSDDLIVIPEYIKSLNPNYKFYLDYYTIIGHEIVLYAIDCNE